MDEHDGRMNRFSNFGHAFEEERRLIHSSEPIIVNSDINLEERSEMPADEKPQIEAPNNREEWLERFANLWQASEKDSKVINSGKTEKKDYKNSSNISLAGEKNDELMDSIEPITEPSLKMKASEAREVSTEKTHGETPLEREEWLERFANLWLACGKNEDLFKEKVKKSKIFSKRDDKHSAEVMSENRNGKVVIDDSLLHDSLINKNQLSEEGKSDKEYSPNPDDLIVFDIDPEIAIKFLTASRGLGS
jgi:hypothetical protein